MSPKVLDIRNTQKEKQERLSPEKQRELAERAKNCDHEAWEKIYKAYKKFILGFFRGKIYDKSISEDLCQEAFLLTYENLKKGKYNPAYSFTTFLILRREKVYKKYLEEIYGKKLKKQKGKKEVKLNHLDKKETFSKELEKELEEKENEDEKIERIPFMELWKELPSQDKDLMRLEGLRLISICCAKPHQLLTFYYVKFLEWKPKEILKELSDKKLGELAERFLDEYLEKFSGRIDKGILFEYYSDLYKKLNKFYNEIYIEQEYEEGRQHNEFKKVKECNFREFYGSNPEASISDWCYKVYERARILLQRGKLCEGGK